MNGDISETAQDRHGQKREPKTNFLSGSTGVDKGRPRGPRPPVPLQWLGKKIFLVKIEGLSSFTLSVLKSSDISTRLRLTRLTFDFEHHLLLLSNFN